MRWFLSIVVLALLALAACNSQATPPATAPINNAPLVTVYKSPT